MATIVTRPPGTRPKPTPDPCTPCPVCGGLQCLCRPRFFAGQLLTDEDLNRLDQYIIEKNRLHNRYLHGWGVVCGLEVVCDPCGNLVRVHPGYALSGCGDDIIVCREESVDVCKLIIDCCSPQPDDCNPPRPRPEGCDDLEQQWILSICYREVPSRGVTALKGADAACCSKCSGGGSSSCGCGCHRKNGGGSVKTAQSSCSPSKKTPPQCEPTVQCESYYFKMQLAPKPDRGTRTTGAMIEQFLACLRELTDHMPAPVTASSSTQDILKWCCDVRNTLIDLFADNPGTSCAVIAALSQPCPQPGPQETPAQYLQRVVQFLLPFLIEYIRHCLCAALLPPCPAPVLDPCVPLATITIRKKDCAIIQICNLEARKFLTTFPNLQYWFSWLPYGRTLRDLLERLCCRAIRLPDKPVTPGTIASFGRNTQTFATPANESASVARLAVNAFQTKDAPPAAVAFSMAALGMYDGNGKPFVPDIVADNPLAAALLKDLAGPLLGNVLPEGAGALFTAAGGEEGARLAAILAAREADITTMRFQIDALQATTQKQQVMIDGLVSRLGRSNT